MGLYAEVSIADVGPNELTNEEFGVSVLVDYSMAIQGFIDTFMSVATSLCPVRTGYLCGSISAGGGGDYAYAEASAEYAQYVEYGTSRMGAQPFFEPALEQAMAVLGEMAQTALDDAASQLEDIVQSLVDEMMSAVSEMMGGGFGGFMGGLIASAIMLVILFPIALYAYGIMDALSPGGPSGFSGDSGSYDSVAGVGGIDIMIT